MKVKYSKHARERLRNRGILRREVEDVLMNGQRRSFQEHGTIKCVYTKKNSKLVVIYHQQKEKYLIVSAYYEN